MADIDAPRTRLPFRAPVNSKKRLSLTLSLGSAPHHKNLPEVFAQNGMLRLAVRLGEHLEVLEPGSSGLKLVHRFSSYHMGNRLIGALWRRLPMFAQSTAPMALWFAITDKMVSRWLLPCDVFHGIAGYSLSSLRRARLLGARTLIDSTSVHPTSWQHDVAADCAAIGLDPKRHERFLSPLLVRRMMRQYEACDKIVIYSSAVQRSFEPFPYASKTVVVRPGVDHHFFAPANASKPDRTFRVCYIGRIECPKGLHHLLLAWKQMALLDAELLLIGRVFSEMRPLLQESPRSVKLAGFLPPGRVACCLGQSDVFVLPSANEGMSLALLEAMAAGVPVIACRSTAAEDCVTPGEDGFLVPARNTEALAEAILWCYNNRDALKPMGRAARARIEQDFTLPHYIQRLVELYESLVT
jgi:glycosyltransferase involved in cell wall biosynthesis